MSFQDLFLDKVKEYNVKDVAIRPINFGLDINSEQRINSVFFKNLHISGQEFRNITFNNCTFIETGFAHIYFDKCSFINCKFVSCYITDCTINSCELVNTEISSGSLIITELFNSHISELSINDDVDMFRVIFDSCFVDKMNSHAICFSNCIFMNCLKPMMMFKQCDIATVKFINVNLTNSCFNECGFNQSSFTHCILNKDTISEKCFRTSYHEMLNPIPNFIDFQTILLSENLSGVVLKLFNINDCDVKDYIMAMTTPVEFQSVFISYSFNDSEFARIINERLKNKGINTFLWEHDAPGGKRLKRIMKEYIEKYDRVLFIASQNSLKSEACHYELRETREKQNKEWKDIYYPIHIDDYLFKLNKEDIPKAYREEFWINIEEIKEYHSVDFSEFKNNYANNPRFDEKIEKLVRNLRL